MVGVLGGFQGGVAMQFFCIEELLCADFDYTI